MGWIFKNDKLGVGYYRDHCQDGPVVLPLDALTTEPPQSTDKTQSPDTDEPYPVLHGLRTIRDTHKKKERLAIATWNSNSIRTCFACVESGGVGDDVEIIALQETKVNGPEIVSWREKFAKHGWSCHLNPCAITDDDGHSGSVGLLVRHGRDAGVV